MTVKPLSKDDIWHFHEDYGQFPMYKEERLKELFDDFFNDIDKALIHERHSDGYTERGRAYLEVKNELKKRFGPLVK